MFEDEFPKVKKGHFNDLRVSQYKSMINVSSIVIFFASIRQARCPFLTCARLHMPDYNRSFLLSSLDQVPGTVKRLLRSLLT